MDASAAVLGLLNDGDARRSLTDDDVAVPYLADTEVTSALRAQVLRRTVPAGDAQRALDRWMRLGVRRYPAVGLLGRVWERRDNLSAYDAAHVSLAVTLGCPLVTGDARLASVPGPTCRTDVVRR